MTPEQVGNLTYREFGVMMERYDEKKRDNYEMQRNVIFNAIVNANRKKGTQIIPLFNENEEKTTIDILKEREELFGTS